jgi:two-component system, NarL family, response regulator LiaR
VCLTGQPEPTGKASILGTAKASMLRLAIAPDAPLVLEGTAAMLAKETADIEVISFGDTADPPGQIDILLYDPQRHVLADLNHVRCTSPQVLAVAYCWSTSSEIVQKARRDGAAAFFSKEVSGKDMVTAIRDMRAGEHAPFTVLNKPPVTKSPPIRPLGLTQRELEILELITHGHSNDEIAHTLFLSINSVKTYIRTAYRKIGASRRAQAVLWGIEHGLRPLSQPTANRPQPATQAPIVEPSRRTGSWES